MVTSLPLNWVLSSCLLKYWDCTAILQITSSTYDSGQVRTWKLRWCFHSQAKKNTTWAALNSNTNIQRLTYLHPCLLLLIQLISIHFPACMMEAIMSLNKTCVTDAVQRLMENHVNFLHFLHDNILTHVDGCWWESTSVFPWRARTVGFFYYDLIGVRQRESQLWLELIDRGWSCSLRWIGKINTMAALQLYSGGPSEIHVSQSVSLALFSFLSLEHPVIF